MKLKKKFCKPFFGLVVGVLSFYYSNGQSLKLDNIQWGEVTKIRDSKGQYRFTLGINGGQYDDQLIPWIGGLGASMSGVPDSLVVVDSKFQVIPCSSKEAAILSKLEFSEPEFRMKLDVVVQNDKSSLIWRICPIRKKGWRYEKLVGGQISYKPQYKLKSRSGTRGFVDNSVLASGSGDWFKIGVVEDGVHKISYEFLEQLGVDMNQLSANAINIFGNGAGMLSISNNQMKYDDLHLNAAFVSDDGDGIFGRGDYLVFYGKGPHNWRPDGHRFKHQLNYYCDTSYYFINVNRAGQGNRVGKAYVSNKARTHLVRTYNDWALHEDENENFLKSGNQWFGDKFDVQTTLKYGFSITDVTQDSTAYAKVRFVGSSKTGMSEYSVTETFSNTGDTKSIDKSGGDADYPDVGKPVVIDLPFKPSSNNINFSVNYNKLGVPSNVGWLDYIEVNLYRNLVYGTNQLQFRHTNSVGNGNVAEFEIINASQIDQLWEVTNPNEPQVVDLTFSGGVGSFKVDADSLRTFVAWNNSNVKVPVSHGAVQHQNLHGLGKVDMVIVSHPKFLPAAEELAQVHESEGMVIHVATTDQVYNEFSSGMRDPIAIRRFVKMFYDRAVDSTEMPQHLLLFGDASYDQRDYTSPNSNYVPVFHSDESLSPLNSFITDDFYGLLDDQDSDKNSDLMDISVGRIPCQTLEEALGVVNKIKVYLGYGESSSTTVHCNTDDQTRFGDWRNMVCLVADDEDNDQFVTQSEEVSVRINTNSPSLNVQKLYMDAYKQQSTPGGQRYPGVSEALRRRVETGALLVNYLGHGGEVGWAHERVLDLNTINNWRNLRRLPVFMTATCEFTRFDDPNRVSAGERVLLNPEGGAIALFTTTRVVYAGPNAQLTYRFYDNVFEKEGSKPRTLGEIYKQTKNAFVAANSNLHNNYRRFSLIGDPAIRLALPQHNVVTTKINGLAHDTITDTARALNLVTVEGEVRNMNGELMDNFNGIVYPTVFDKVLQRKTLGNDKGSKGSLPFETWANRIYKGKATVKKGKFSFSFVVPRDISYDFGPGRISYYTQNGQVDGTGLDESLVIGGTDNSNFSDDVGPEVELYMNDEKFVFGGITDENPSIFAKISDENGINTVGNGIGHDIVAVLDEETKNSIVLNDYYSADIDTYKSGQVKYPFSKLSEGKHTLSLKVWDVHNNSSREVTEFVVAKSALIALDHVLNYPNPFTDRTEFMFEHNQVCNFLKVQIQIFTISGKVVKTIDQVVHTKGFRADPISWDGRDDFGDNLGRGVYVYKIKVLNEQADVAEEMEKLVILN